MSEQELLEFCNKSCKNNSHNLCVGQWAGLGFNVKCNCECHRKVVLDKAILKNDSSDGNNVIRELNSLGESNK